MKDLEKIIAAIRPLDEGYLKQAQERLDNLTKPVGSLGKLELIARRYAAIKEDLTPVLGKRKIFTLAGDHGVVRQGVSAYPREVTVQMVLNMLAGGAAVNVLGRHVGAEVIVVDMGVDHDFEPADGLVIKKVGYGTDDFTEGPAMSRDEAIQSVTAGIELVGDCARDGVDVIGTGDMGIGNTTPSSAILSVLAGLPPREITGRGTGIDDGALLKKIDAIERAIAVNKPDPKDPLDVLAKVGGFEIGGIAGLVIGGAYYRIPVIVDGFISTAGALLAVALNPLVREYIFYSHLSAEAGHRRMLEFLGQEPIMDLDMRLGEGTGSAIAMSVMDAALKIMNEMATFDSAGVDKESERCEDF